MATKKYGPSITLLLIPQADRRSVALRLPVALLVSVFAALVVTAFAVGLYWARLTTQTRTLQAENAGLQQLRHENLRQKQDLDKMAGMAALIAGDLEKLSAFDQTVRGMLRGAGLATDNAAGSATDQLTGNSAEIPPDTHGGVGGGGGAVLSDRPNRTGTEARTQLPARSGTAAGRGRPARLPGAEPDLLHSFVALQEEAGQRLQFATETAKDLETHLDFVAHRPTGYPVPGRITSPFGWRDSPFGYGLQQHDGVDLAADYGDPVLATADGTVEFSGWRAGGYGLAVLIDHGYGLRTLYAHNDELLVQVGEQVRRGHRIANAGSTGDSTGPHVHYEVFLWGQPLDPTPYR